jgi:hypothetical protein
VYGPCDHERKLAFLDWLNNIQMPDEENWPIVGDFNLLRWPEDRNRSSGSANEMLFFNELISSLGIEQIPLHGRRFTWTNKQQPPF